MSTFLEKHSHNRSWLHPHIENETPNFFVSKSSAVRHTDLPHKSSRIQLKLTRTYISCVSNGCTISDAQILLFLTGELC